MSYTAALKMPSSYAVMNEEEMVYLEGGGINVNTKMLDKNYCLEIAKNYTASTGLSQSRIAMEIYAHAILYFGGLTARDVIGLDNKIVAEIIDHANPIDLGGDHLGRVAAYSAIWALTTPIIV